MTKPERFEVQDEHNYRRVANLKHHFDTPKKPYSAPTGWKSPTPKARDDMPYQDETLSSQQKKQVQQASGVFVRSKGSSEWRQRYGEESVKEIKTPLRTTLPYEPTPQSRFLHWTLLFDDPEGANLGRSRTFDSLVC